MKKFFYFLFLVVIAVCAPSCMPSPEADSVQPGRNIYAMAMNQNNHSMMPVEAAYRLNILLSEAREQEITDLGKVTVPVTVEDEDGEEEVIYVNLVNLLFDRAGITAEAGGIYRITFQNSLITWITADLNVKTGVIVVNTGEKLLDELEGDDAWGVEIDSSDTQFRYYVQGSKNSLEMIKGIYAIGKGKESSSWDINVSQSKITLNTGNDVVNTSNWNGAFTLKQGDSAGFLYMSACNSYFNLSGSANGFNFYGVNMNLKLDSLMYVPSCEDLLISGLVRAAFSNFGEINQSQYPAGSVEVYFKKGTEKCDYSIDVTYNGRTVTE